MLPLPPAPPRSHGCVHHTTHCVHFAATLAPVISRTRQPGLLHPITPPMDCVDPPTCSNPRHTYTTIHTAPQFTVCLPTVYSQADVSRAPCCALALCVSASTLLFITRMPPCPVADCVQVYAQRAMALQAEALTHADEAKVLSDQLELLVPRGLGILENPPVSPPVTHATFIHTDTAPNTSWYQVTCSAPIATAPPAYARDDASASRGTSSSHRITLQQKNKL